MSATSEVTQALLAVLREIDGLRPATPSIKTRTSWMSWDLDAIAIDVNDDLIEIRLVALMLPLPPILRHAEASLRSVLEGTAWKHARLRLIVTDIDATAFTAGPVVGAGGQGDARHMIGP
ncbi:MAG: hypothetical protein M3548_02900 [Actinomycetota bacterium]|nr:hypothetical protein [Actinomycetota bacterium]